MGRREQDIKRPDLVVEELDPGIKRVGSLNVVGPACIGFLNELVHEPFDVLVAEAVDEGTGLGESGSDILVLHGGDDLARGVRERPPVRVGADG